MPIQLDTVRFVDGSDPQIHHVFAVTGDVRIGTVRYLLRSQEGVAGQLLNAPQQGAQAVCIIGQKSKPLVFDSGTTFYVERVK